MALPGSGSISFSQINQECNYASNRETGLNDSRVRLLFGVNSGQISFSNGYSKDGDPSITLYINFYPEGREVYFWLQNIQPYGYYELINYGDYCWGCTLFTAWDFGVDNFGNLFLYFGPAGRDDPSWYPAPKWNVIYCRGYDKFGDWYERELGAWTSS